MVVGEKGESKSQFGLGKKGEQVLEPTWPIKHPSEIRTQSAVEPSFPIVSVLSRSDFILGVEVSDFSLHSCEVLSI